MKIRLNLATQPLESNRSFAVGAALVGGFGVAAMLLLSWHVYSVWRANTTMRKREASIEADMARLRGERAQLLEFFNRADTVQKRNRAGFLNQLIAQRAFPWIKIFAALERSLPVGVRVVSIEPHLEADHLELRFTIGATDDQSKLKFLKALEDSPEFSQIEVLSENRSARPNEIDHVVLALQARYASI